MESSGTGAVIEPLLTIEREDLTGSLEFEARGIRTSIHAVAGEIVFAEGGTLGEALGRMLLRCQRLGEEHFGAVIRRMTDALSDDKVIRFGEVLVEYGFLSAEDLDLALTQQVREKLMGCVHRGAGQWRFTADAAADSVAHHVVRTRPTLVEAARQLSERRIEEILRLGEHRFPEIVAPEKVVAVEFELTPEEAAILVDLNGTSSLHFILPKAGTQRVAPLIAALVLGGGVELRAAPAGGRAAYAHADGNTRPIPPTFMTLRRALPEPESPQNALPRLGDPEVTGSLRGPLGLPTVRDHSGASHSTVAARRMHDRRLSRDTLTPNPPQAQERTRRAFERLRSDLELRKPTSDRRRWPEPMDERERRLMAESAFHRGRLYLRAEEAERALPGLSRAHELRPDEREYELYVRWAQMLVNDSFTDDRRRGEMQDLAIVVVREDPWCELAFSVLGQCAFHDGKDEAALRFFQRAAHLDPKRLDASRLTDLLAGRRAENPRMLSNPDLRSRARGELRTLLDEIVPQAIANADAAPAAKRAPAKGTATLRPAPPSPEDLAPGDDVPIERQTPFGGLAVSTTAPLSAPPSSRASSAPSASASPSLPPVSTSRLPPPSLPPPSASRPAPASTRPPASRPAPPPSRSPGPPASSASPAPPGAAAGSPPPLARPPPTSPWRIATGGGSPRTQPLPVQAQPQPPVPPPPVAIDRAAEESDEESEVKPPRRRVVGIALGMWITALSAAAAVFYLVTTDHPSLPSTTAQAGSGPGAPVATAPSVSAVLPASTSPSPSATETTAEPPSAASSGGGTTTAGAPALVTALDGRAPTTGLLRAPRASYGRRIYVDGHIIGEGGHDLTAPCGTHRVRVGSTGIDRTLTIPCGSTLEL